MSRHHKGGRQWQQAQRELHSRGDAYCWRGCGTYLLVDAPRGHPQFMTIGHYIAVQDGGAQFDPTNYGPECQPCNYSDGARRTNRKLGNPHHPKGETRQTVTNPNWYDAYQVGKAMVFDPSITKDGCPICGNTVPNKRRYCTTACRTEYRRRTSRARGDRKAGKVVRDLTIPSTFRSESFGIA